MIGKKNFGKLTNKNEILSGEIMNDKDKFKEEIIEKILGLDIKVLTSKGEEKIIRITDIVTGNSLSSTLSVSNHCDRHYDTLSPFLFKVIEAKIECLNYSMAID